MKFETHDFRHADEILQNRKAWHELRTVIEGIGATHILAAQEELAARGRAPAGAQSAVNLIFRERLEPLRWEKEPRLFRSGSLRAWKMDFFKDRIGVEVSFNHAEAIPWTFTRLNIAGESRDVMPEHQIDVGIAIFATASLKAWGRMDAAVSDFEVACTWLELMKPIMPIPVLVIGLLANELPTTDAFRGTRRRPLSDGGLDTPT